MGRRERYRSRTRREVRPEGHTEDAVYRPGAGYRQRAEQRGYVEAGYGPDEGDAQRRYRRPEEYRPSGGEGNTPGEAFGGAGIGGHIQGSFGQHGPLGQRLFQTGGSSASGVSEPGPERAGGYRGRGPRGYQRADQRILEEVCDLLCDDDYVDAADMEVAVEAGEVTLTGAAPDRFTKRRAEELAESCRGVHDVHNQLRVKRPE